MHRRIRNIIIGASALGAVTLSMTPATAQDAYPIEQSTTTVATEDTSNVRGIRIERGEQAASDGLPVTGSDAVGLAGIGLLAVGAGAVALASRKRLEASE